MKIDIEIDEAKLKDLIYSELERTLGDIGLDRTKVTIEVKSKNNWKSEWEEASFRARVHVER